MFMGRVEEQAYVVHADVLDESQPLIYRIDEVHLETVERLDGELDAALGSVIRGALQACDRRLPLVPSRVGSEQARRAGGGVH
jgi:hypothetical protein